MSYKLPGMQFDARQCAEVYHLQYLLFSCERNLLKKTHIKLFKKSIILLNFQINYISFSTMLAAHIMITGTNNLNIVTMSANLIVFFIILLHNRTYYSIMRPPFNACYFLQLLFCVFDIDTFILHQNVVDVNTFYKNI